MRGAYRTRTALVHAWNGLRTDHPRYSKRMHTDASRQAQLALPYRLHMKSPRTRSVGPLVTVHEVRVQDMTLSPTLTALCAGFEDGEWRSNQLTQDIFDRHLASFALSFTEWSEIDGNTAAMMLRKAAKAVYATKKYGLRGEFGELLLHAAVKDFFDAQPAVSKIHFKDSANDTVKGFDCVHLVESDGEIELWLGEVKYYKSLSKAITDVVAELKDHVAAGFLRREFIAITNKLDSAWAHTEMVKQLLHEHRTLDEIRDRLVIPVMLTYDSETVATHSANDETYRSALTAEVNAGWNKFAAAVDDEFPVTLHLILVPLASKKRLTNLFHQRLEVWKHL